MNSDPHESAAWRTFGMLDADEAAGFDEAMRRDPELRSAYREMECLTAAVAAVTTRPVPPRAGQLERLHLRLGLNASKHTNWLGISGWGAAAALALLLVFQRGPAHRDVAAQPKPPTPQAAIPQASGPALPQPTETTAAEEGTAEPPHTENTAETDPTAPAPGGEVKTIVKVETKRLIQEIEVLREKLQDFQERDRQRFEPVAGMAWPIVMRMTRPKDAIGGSDARIQEQEDPTITTMLGDAMASATRSAPQTDPAVAEPSAIPIYDPARNTGTLYVNNLEPTQEGENYYLWAATKKGGKPSLVGKLPKSDTPGPESFDFNLASDSGIPSTFTLTKDHGVPTSPSATNTILRGPR